MTAAEWLVLDNLRCGWPYRMDLNEDRADEAYRQCVENQWIKDGKLTQDGLDFLLSKKIYETSA